MSVRASFETFPPQTPRAAFRLYETTSKLAAFAPRFVSVTFGAGGTRQDLTADTCKALASRTTAPVAAHLTIARQTREQVLAHVDDLAQDGITDIVALRGDGDGAGAPFKPHPDGFRSSLELVEALAADGRFTIRVGAYPESHRDAASTQQNIDYLKAKLDAGADEALTQFFFEADTFLRFRDACVRAGIEQRITPGILPVQNWARARQFAESCGATIPDLLSSGFDTAIRDGRERLFATAVCTEMCSKLIEEGVDSLHFYTLNRAEMTAEICTALGLRTAVTELRDVA